MRISGHRLSVQHWAWGHGSGIRNVYNIIESISPIHFWHHYLCSRLTITCERRRSVPPRVERQSRASSPAVWSCTRCAPHSTPTTVTSQRYSGNSLLAGFRTDVSGDRDALCIRTRNACVLSARCPSLCVCAASQWNLWRGPPVITWIAVLDRRIDSDDATASAFL